MFIDRAVIIVHAGKGGDGCVAFRRARGIPKGGPNGGDGGDGGSVIAAADPEVNTLLDFRGRHDWRAGAGEPGRGSQQHGAKGEDRVIRLPPGTLIYDEESGELLTDLGPGDRVVVARGGAGGFGNEHFKGPTNQTPQHATPGGAGERRTLRLELKLIADVGLVGLPNAGKSTLLSVLTRATPKIADYPFTTLSPQLGIAEVDAGRRLVLADIPGLIEGASAGAGLGHDFLRHIERTRVLAHLLEVGPLDGSDPVANYRAIRGELAAHSAVLADKPEIIALSKVDLSTSEEELVTLEARVREASGHGKPVVRVSSASGRGLEELLRLAWEMVEEWEL